VILIHVNFSVARDNRDAIGIDLGKTVFHLVGLSQTGEVVVRKKFSRPQLLRFTSNVQVDLIGMEACPSGSIDREWRAFQCFASE
jgi:hypothetical protein